MRKIDLLLQLLTKLRRVRLTPGHDFATTEKREDKNAGLLGVTAGDPTRNVLTARPASDQPERQFRREREGTDTQGQRPIPRNTQAEQANTMDGRQDRPHRKSARKYRHNRPLCTSLHCCVQSEQTWPWA